MGVSFIMLLYDNETKEQKMPEDLPMQVWHASHSQENLQCSF